MHRPIDSSGAAFPSTAISSLRPTAATPRLMRLVRTRAELAEALAGSPRPVGLVPTMGWLHAGHASLIATARAADATVVVTIFVNPRQFNETSDYARYPRNEARDVELCARQGADIVFAPEVDQVYPPGFDTTVRVGAIAAPLEGAARPGHFDGVATVVAILFGLVRADRAYFGQKDAQQVLVVRRMALDLALGTQVVACPIVREPDGLALSSRNVHLTADQRAAAPVLRRALLAAAARYRDGERSAAALREALRGALSSEPLAEVDYVSCADASSLVELDRVDRPALLSLAVRFGATRLIDNETIGTDSVD